MKVIDTRGLSCPQPVVMVLQQIKKSEGPFDVLLDSEASRENVMRLLKKNGKEVTIEDKDEETIYHVK